MTQVLNYRQLQEWLIYESIEPFETERADSRAALQTFWNAEMWLQGHKGKPQDYQLNFGSDEPTDDNSEARQLMNEIKGMFL